jgi:hypothetical protein
MEHGEAFSLYRYWSSLTFRDIVSFSRVDMHGPTHFAPILRECLNHAVRHPCTQEKQVYHVLVIVTDGCINDMKATTDVIVELANHPVSIIIVGVGNEDFSKMVKLDGDHGNAHYARRLIWC